MTNEGEWYNEAIGPLGLGLVNVYTRLTAPKLSEYGLAPIQWGILIRCYNGQADTVTGLAGLIPIDTASLSRHVNSLVEKGLLRRRRLHTDRRVVRLVLTEEAKVVIPEITQFLQEVNEKLYSNLSTEDRKTFLRVVQKIIANSESYDPNECN